MQIFCWKYIKHKLFFVLFVCCDVALYELFWNYRVNIA